MIDKAKLDEEFEEYSPEELQYIYETQQDLYSPEELDYMKETVEKKKEALSVAISEFLPDEIECEKCGGPNKFSNDVCEYCGHELDKSPYFRRAARLATGEDPEEAENDEERSESYLFHMVISFVIPLVGLIMGAIMLTSNDADKREIGKRCIIIAIAAMILGGILISFFWSNLL